MAMELEKLEVPEGVRGGLQRVVEAAKSAFAEKLVSVVLFGSAAEGKLRASSDVNVVVVLSRFDAAKADGIREPMRTAEATIRLRAMFVLESEIPDAARAFAQKFADILRRHVVLYGKDVFAGMRVERQAEVFRLQQVLLNLLLRMREEYVSRSQREEQMARLLAEHAGPLRTSAAAILELEGQGRLSPKDALARVARELEGEASGGALGGEAGGETSGRESRGGGFAGALTSLSTAREQGVLPAGAAGPAMLGVMELAQRMHGRAKRLK